MKRLSARMIKPCLCLVTVLGLSACTTVDLSQVTMNPAESKTVTQRVSIVEMASVELTSAFDKKGWTNSNTREKAQSAASVLLNGLQKNTDGRQGTRQEGSAVSARNFSSSIVFATQYVQDTYKAATLYIDYIDDAADISTELSNLEAALLSAKAAERKFITVSKQSANLKTNPQLRIYQDAVSQLSKVTDQYGVRARTMMARNIDGKGAS